MQQHASHYSHLKRLRRTVNSSSFTAVAVPQRSLSTVDEVVRCITAMRLRCSPETKHCIHVKFWPEWSRHKTDLVVTQETSLFGRYIRHLSGNTINYWWYIDLHIQSLGSFGLFFLTVADFKNNSIFHCKVIKIATQHLCLKKIGWFTPERLSLALKV